MEDLPIHDRSALALHVLAMGALSRGDFLIECAELIGQPLTLLEQSLILQAASKLGGGTPWLSSNHSKKGYGPVNITYTKNGVAFLKGGRIPKKK
jgi:hypothetical protein